MDFDFALILTVVTLIAGLICLADKLFFKQHKSPAQQATHEGTIKKILSLNMVTLSFLCWQLFGYCAHSYLNRLPFLRGQCCQL